MLSLRQYHFVIYICVLLFIIEFYFFGNAAQFAVAHICVFIFLALRTLSIPSRKRMKLLMIFTYFALLFFQLTFVGQIGFGEIRFLNLDKLFNVISLAFPFVIERFFIVNKHVSFYFPSIQEITTFSFNELSSGIDKVLAIVAGIRKTGSALSVDHLGEIAADLPRHNSFRYINDGTLTEEYFAAARESLDDPHIYIVISNTGSAASELISVFTRKQYNHASLSFDTELKTIISYNGGDRIYPPGLNPEMIEYFHRKPDASILVYRLEADREQKEKILEQVREINENGSAYNILGLVLKYSYKSNILFCSQFVYKMLECAGLQYFIKEDTEVRPMDFVEMDTYRKLQFAYEIRFTAGEAEEGRTSV